MTFERDHRPSPQAVARVAAEAEEHRRRVRVGFRSWLRWMPFGFVLGVVLATAIRLVLSPVLDPRAVQGLGMGVLFAAVGLDWRRVREVPWQSYALHTTLMVGLALVVWWVMPQ